VEAIEHVLSVDDVTTPAAGGGFERLVASDGGLTVEVLRVICLEDLQEARPDLVDELKKGWLLVRQTETVKKLQSETDRLSEALSDAQDRLTALLADHEALGTQLTEKTLELELERILRAARLPAVYEDDLRARLLGTDVSQWSQIIETEKKKAATGQPRVSVNGAGQQVHSGTPMIETVRPPVYNANTPEEHAEFMARLKRR
jgi:hypothetical protein